MAVLNRIVNILILVLVITAGVFSFMLYSKRENLTKGMKNMAEAINKTAATLDRGSGTNTKNSLSTDKLGHKNGPDFSGALKELDKAAGKVIAQRDSLAGAIEKAARELGNSSTVKKEALTRVDSYNDPQKKFEDTVKNYKRSADGVRSEFARIGKSVGAKVSDRDFAGNYAAAAAEVDRKIKEIVRTKNQVANDIAFISRTLGVSGTYSTSNTRAWKDAINRRRNELNKMSSELRTYKKLADQQEKKIGSLNKAVEARDDTIDKQKAKIDHYEQVITDDGKKPMPKLQLKSDSPECYSFVKGKVIYVNEEYGFVQINVGKNYVIVQEYGTKKNNVHFPLQSGLVMTVSRGTGEKIVPVAKILVKTVNDESSICNVIEGAVAGINVGDDVSFTKDDRAKIPAAKGK